MGAVRRKPPQDNALKECKSHCSGCGAHFASDEAFDLHRRGSFDDRYCGDPHECERKAKDGTMVRSLEIAQEYGTCELCDGPPRVGVIIWRRVRSKVDVPLREAA